MSYEKMTPDKWTANLLSGKFENVASAKKSIAKTSWPDRTKDRTRKMAEQHFSQPGTVKPADLHKRNGNGEEDGMTIPMGIRVDAGTTAAKLAGVQHVVRACKEVFDALETAHRLYPEADVSNGQLLLDKIMPRAIAELADEASHAFVNKGNGQAVATNGVPPIVPSFTAEQKELFDKSRPKPPFQPPTS